MPAATEPVVGADPVGARLRVQVLAVGKDLKTTVSRRFMPRRVVGIY